jgi:hypothetical protein
MVGQLIYQAMKLAIFFRTGVALVGLLISLTGCSTERTHYAVITHNIEQI